MDQSILSGPIMSAVGILTVFVALTIIVLVVSLAARILGRTGRSVTADDGTSEPANQADSLRDDERPEHDELLRQVALAAYAFHLSRSVSVRKHVASSPWLRAGRQAQVNRAPRS